MTAEQAAEKLGLGKSHVMDLCRWGRLKAEKVDGSWDVDDRAVSLMWKKRKIPKEKFAQIVARVKGMREDRCPKDCPIFTTDTDYNCLAEDNPCIYED